MSIVNTTDSSFETDIQTPQAVLLDFWAPWCGPCLALAPLLEKLLQRVGSGLKILKVNVDDNPLTAQKFSVRAFPTLVFLVNGREEGRLAGTTANRLQFTVEKWMNDHGYQTDVGDVQPLAAPLPDAVRKALSFGGNPAAKRVCLERLRALVDDHQTSPTQQLVGDGPGLAESYGLPLAIGALLDQLWRVNDIFGYAPFADLHATLLRLVEAIPVGVNLQPMLKQFHHDAAHTLPWAMEQYPVDAAARAVIDAIRAIHDRELKGDVLPESAWMQVEKQAILLPVGPDPDNSLSRLLENASAPLGGDRMVLALSALTYLAMNDVRQAPHWTESDAVRYTASEEAFDAAAIAALGMCPFEDTDKAGYDAWQPAFAAFVARWNADKRAADPVYWARYDAQQANDAAIRRRMHDYLIAQLSSRLAALLP